MTPAIENENVQQVRLSPQQRRLWLHDGQSAAFAAQCAVSIEGDLDVAALRRAVERVVAGHEILRTAFRRPVGIKVPTQTILAEGVARWRELDSAGRSWETLFEQELCRPTDVEEGSPLSVALVRVDLGRHLLLYRLPALCSDRRTLGNLLDLIVRAYADGAGGDDEPLQYADFSEWQNELLGEADEHAEAGRAFWARQDLAGPAGNSEGRAEPFRPAVLGLALPEGLPEDLLPGLWTILLERLEARRDPGIGRVLDGRKFDDLQGALGLFAKCLPLRLPLDSAWSLGEVRDQLQQAETEAREWQEYAAWEPEQAAFPLQFETAEIGAERASLGVVFRPLRQYTCSEPFRIKLSVVRHATEVRAELWYDAA